MSINLTCNAIIYIYIWYAIKKFKNSFVVKLPNVSFVGKKYVPGQCVCSFCGFHSLWQAAEYPWGSLNPI